MMKGWQQKQLGKLAELKGRIGWRGLTAKEYTNSGPLFLSVHSLNYGDYVDFRDAFHISEERYVESPEIMLQPDDVLICKDGAGIGKIGIVGTLPDRTTINSSLLLIRSGDQILPKFLYRCLSSPYFQQIVNSRLNGATTPHLYQRDITEFPVVLPPIPEQHRIVGILDEAFEGIATAKANAKKNLQNARAIFESHLHSVFTQRGEGWEMKPLGEVCVIKPPKREARHRLSADELVSFLPMEDLGIDEKFVRASHAKPLSAVAGSYTYFADGDVLLAKITPCFENGKLGIAKGLTNGIGFGSSEYIVFRPNETLRKEWLYYYLSRAAFRVEGAARMSGAVGHKRVAKEFIEAYAIVVPPLPEQQRIVSKLDSLRGEAQRLESLYQRKLAALDVLKKSLLHQAFTGQL